MFFVGLRAQGNGFKLEHLGPRNCLNLFEGSCCVFNGNGLSILEPFELQYSSIALRPGKPAPAAITTVVYLFLPLVPAHWQVLEFRLLLLYYTYYTLRLRILIYIYINTMS